MSGAAAPLGNHAMANVLSQEEIDALLGGLSEGQIGPNGNDQDAATAEGRVTPFDFSDQDRFLPGRLPTLDTIHDRFARLVRMYLSTLLRRPVEIQIANQMVCSFKDFSHSLERPASLHILRLEPYKGTMLLVLPARLILTLVDFMFGGEGRQIPIGEDRDFTLIENRVIQKFAEEISRCYTESWAPVHPIHIQPVGSEVNVQFINIAGPNEPVNVVDCELTIENNRNTLSLCIPYGSIDPVKEILKGLFVNEELELDAHLTARIRNALMETSVQLNAILGAATISGRDLLRLKPGDIIQLDEDSEAPAEILIEGKRKFWGLVGAHRSNRALQITGIEEPEKVNP